MVGLITLNDVPTRPMPPMTPQLDRHPAPVAVPLPKAPATRPSTGMHYPRGHLRWSAPSNGAVGPTAVSGPSCRSGVEGHCFAADRRVRPSRTGTGTASTILMDNKDYPSRSNRVGRADLGGVGPRRRYLDWAETVTVDERASTRTHQVCSTGRPTPRDEVVGCARRSAPE